MGDAAEASSLTRFHRKWRELGRYRGLSVSYADSIAVGLLGLVRCRVLPLSWARFVLGAWRAPVVTPRLRSTGGLRVRVDLSNGAQIDIFDEIFVDRIYDLSAVPFEPTLILDCGGYCGYFSVLAAGRFPRARTFCFEPHPDNLALIRAQMAIASVKLELVPMAVAAEAGRVRFEGSGMGGRVAPGPNRAGGLEVEAINFPEFLTSVSAKRLLWKLDIEGGEREVFPLALKHLPQETCCFLETHHPDQICDEMFGPYRAAGFAVSEIRRRQSQEANIDFVEWILIRS